MDSLYFCLLSPVRVLQANAASSPWGVLDRAAANPGPAGVSATVSLDSRYRGVRLRPLCEICGSECSAAILTQGTRASTTNRPRFKVRVCTRRFCFRAFINLNSLDLGSVLGGTYCLVWQTEGMTEKCVWGGGWGGDYETRGVL